MNLGAIMKTKLKSGLVGAGLVAALAFTACGDGAADAAGTSAEGETLTIRMATDGTATGSAVALGVEQGFFEEEGLDVELSASANPPAAVAALQSNELDVASIPVIPALNAQSQSIDIKSIAPAAGFPDDPEAAEEFDVQAVMVMPESGIESPADLEGKKVGVPARQAIFEAFIIDAMENEGADPEKVEWIALDFTSQVESLRTGRIDAAAVPLPFTVEAEEDGATVLWRPGLEFYEGGQTSTWLISPELQDNTEVAERIQRAIRKSNEYANENTDAAIEAGSELTGIDPELLRSSEQFNYFPSEVDVEALALANEKLVEMDFINQSVNVDDFVILPTQ